MSRLFRDIHDEKIVHLRLNGRAPRNDTYFRKRRRVWMRTEGACFYCGDDIALVDMEVEHFQPIARGGLNVWENLFPSCAPCNRSKGAFTIDEWRFRKSEGRHHLFYENQMAWLSRQGFDFGEVAQHQFYFEMIGWVVCRSRKPRDYFRAVRREHLE